MDETEKYRAMLERADIVELKGVLDGIDKDRYPEKYSIAREVYGRKSAAGAVAREIKQARNPQGKLSRNWYLINATLVGLLSLNSFYSAISFSDQAINFNWVSLAFAVSGVAAVVAYFWKFKLGHYLMLAWWLPQLLKVTYQGVEYSLNTGMTLGLEFKVGSCEVSFNLLAAISLLLLRTYRRYYFRRVVNRLQAARQVPG